jgi:DNA polymerase III gamma/tau subunit
LYINEKIIGGMMGLDKKYRPTKLEEVVGQKSVVNTLKTKSKVNEIPHAMIFHGPSGVGKTTLARIVASLLDAPDVLEVDGASYTGVDDMRDIANYLKYPSLQGNKRKFLILDEAHMLSKNAWNSWLKMIEEPPEHVYFAFCTTEYSRVLDTIKTRCTSFKLNPIKDAEVKQTIKTIVQKENIKIEERFIDKVVTESRGSLRQAIVYLEQIKDAPVEEIDNILNTAIERDEVTMLCRYVVDEITNLDYKLFVQKINTVSHIDPESLKILIVGYMTQCIFKNEKASLYDAEWMAFMLDCMLQTDSRTMGGVISGLLKIYFDKWARKYAKK